MVWNADPAFGAHSLHDNKTELAVAPLRESFFWAALLNPASDLEEGRVPAEVQRSKPAAGTPKVVTAQARIIRCSYASTYRPQNRILNGVALYAKDWVVYAKPPFGGPEQVLKYLARYTHRVAISNQRLVAVDNDAVTFRYKDYAADGRQRLLTLSAEEFLRRFVQHVLPKSFVKIRHYGLLANRQRQQRLDQCRRLLLATSALTGGNPAARGVGDADPPATPPSCPRCGSRRLVHHPLPAQPAAPPTDVGSLPGDTS